jgi:hypothetical protein
MQESKSNFFQSDSSCKVQKQRGTKHNPKIQNVANYRFDAALVAIQTLVLLGRACALRPVQFELLKFNFVFYWLLYFKYLKHIKFKSQKITSRNRTSTQSPTYTTPFPSFFSVFAFYFL